MRQGLIHDMRAGNRKRDYKQNKINLDLENTEWLGKAANTRRVLYAEPDSELDIHTEGSVRQLTLGECYMQNNSRQRGRGSPWFK